MWVEILRHLCFSGLCGADLLCVADAVPPAGPLPGVPALAWGTFGPAVRAAPGQGTFSQFRPIHAHTDRIYTVQSHVVHPLLQPRAPVLEARERLLFASSTGLERMSRQRGTSLSRGSIR